MVLARSIERWQDERSMRKTREQVSAWIESLGLPSLKQLEGGAHLTDEQMPALRHVSDVLQNGRCTDPTCPLRNQVVPEFIQRVA